MNSSAWGSNSNQHQTDFGEVNEIAKATAPVENNVLAGVVGGGVLDGFGPGELDKCAAFPDVNVASSNSSSGFLHRRVIGEKVLTVAARTEDGNRAKSSVGIKPDVTTNKTGIATGCVGSSAFKGRR